MNGFRGKKRGYTIIEVLVVVTIIGILSALGYASLTDAIQMSRAKDNARNMTAFVERALMDGKRKNIDICIKCSGDKMLSLEANSSTNPKSCSTTPINNFELLGGFTCINTNADVIAEIRIGLSSSPAAIFTANKGLYYARTEKTNNNNHFTAKISKDNGSNWEDLK